MQQLIFISTARPNLRIYDIDALVDQSRRNNERDSVSSLLVHHRTRFLQAMEGPSGIIQIAFDRIKVDQRHRAAVTLYRRTIDQREFGIWPMAFVSSYGVDTTSLVDGVDELVAGVKDRNVRAVFTSFARLERAAA